MICPCNQAMQAPWPCSVVKWAWHLKNHSNQIFLLLYCNNYCISSISILVVLLLEICNTSTDREDTDLYPLGRPVTMVDLECFYSFVVMADSPHKLLCVLHCLIGWQAMNASKTVTNWAWHHWMSMSFMSFIISRKLSAHTYDCWPFLTLRFFWNCQIE